MTDNTEATENVNGQEAGFLIRPEEIGIVFEALGRALKQCFNDPQTNLHYVFAATDLLKRLTPVAQGLAQQQQQANSAPV